MKLVLEYNGGATLLSSVKAAFFVLEPIEKVSGLMSNEIKVKSLKSHWKSKSTVNRSKYGGVGNY